MGHIGNPRKRQVTDDEVVAAYRVGLSVYKAERTLGISASTIYRVLERRGVKRRGLEQYRKDAARFRMSVARQIRFGYENGSSYADLVQRFGGTMYSVKSAIKRAGGTLVPVTPPRTEEDARRILSLHAGGMSQMKISLKIGRSQSLVSRVLKQHGVTPARRAGASHGQWKGGRWVNGYGYVKVMVSDDDPLACMREANGYVSEHRLILARRMGRPLRLEETVHHLNGNRADNSDENLELRVGRHGKGAVMTCLDCGSRNIGHAKATAPSSP